jgi:LDH2 family malate/lactate/ureidoglycolate dehydrogenase
MKVSFNELESLSRKAFIGMGFSDGQAADAADMLCWMESLGIRRIESAQRRTGPVFP